mgnify:CR=1 FL=1
MASDRERRAFDDALTRGGLTGAALANGKNLAFVAVGASPALPMGSAFHAFAPIFAKLIAGSRFCIVGEAVKLVRSTEGVAERGKGRQIQ